MTEQPERYVTGGYVPPEPRPRYADLRLAVRHFDGHCVPRAIIVDESDGEQISEVLLLRLAEHIVETFNAVPELRADRDALSQRVASYERETASLRTEVTRLQAEKASSEQQISWLEGQAASLKKAKQRASERANTMAWDAVVRLGEVARLRDQLDVAEKALKAHGMELIAKVTHKVEL